MYTGSHPGDATALKEKIKNFENIELEEDFIGISDWESGIIEPQIANFAHSIKSETNVSHVWSVTAEDLVGLYNLGTYAAVSFLHANGNSLPSAQPVIQGVCFNPYLTSHPWFELYTGYVPLLYWQGNPAASTVSRAKSVAFAAVRHFFPTVDVNKLVCHLNSSRNCGGEFFATPLKETLDSQGFSTIRENDYSQDEVWDLRDGLNSPCELIAQELVTSSELKSARAWFKSAVPLTPEDILELAKLFPEFEVERR